MLTNTNIRKNFYGDKKGLASIDVRPFSWDFVSRGKDRILSDQLSLIAAAVIVIHYRVLIYYKDKVLRRRRSRQKKRKNFYIVFWCGGGFRYAKKETKVDVYAIIFITSFL